MAGWFDIDKEGLCKQAKGRGPAFVFVELIANALDEQASGVTEVVVCVQPLENKPYAKITVEDNSPRGYGDHLNHAWTLFAESYKRKNPAQSGQFNFGCKLWLSLCKSASIQTTTGTVVFDGDGRSIHPRRKREVGTLVEGVMYLTRSDYQELEGLMQSLLLPPGVKVTFNGKLLKSHSPITVFQQTLPTTVADEDGVMRPTIRNTSVSVFSAGNEQPMLYELGIPVVESPTNWHISIGQKVPLNRDRDNVTPAYARKVKTFVANHMRSLLTAKDAKWCQDVLADPDAEADTIEQILDITEGKNRVLFDIKDKEANARAQVNGATVIPLNRYTKEQWEGIRSTGTTPLAGVKYATPKPWSDDPNATPADYYAVADWTLGMKTIAEYSVWLGKACGINGLRIAFAKKMNSRNVLACYGHDSLEFNMQKLGKDWFQHGVTQEVNELIIHELAHHFIKSHFLKEEDEDQPDLKYFYDACCRVGAILADLVAKSPEVYRGFSLSATYSSEDSPNR